MPEPPFWDRLRLRTSGRGEKCRRRQDGKQEKHWGSMSSRRRAVETLPFYSLAPCGPSDVRAVYGSTLSGGQVCLMSTRPYELVAGEAPSFLMT